MMDIDTALQTFLRRHPEIRIAILYGSLSSGRQGFESDLDLAVELDRPMTAGEKMRLIEELSELSGRPVDLIDLRTVGEPLLGQIVKTGRRLKGTDARFAELLKRHLFAVADFLPYQRRILRERRQAWLRK